MKFLLGIVFLISGCATVTNFERRLDDIDRHLELIQAILDQDEKCWGIEDKIYRLPRDEGYP